MCVMHFEYTMKWKERKKRLECQVRGLFQLGASDGCIYIGSRLV